MTCLSENVVKDAHSRVINERIEVRINTGQRKY